MSKCRQPIYGYKMFVAVANNCVPLVITCSYVIKGGLRALTGAKGQPTVKAAKVNEWICMQTKWPFRHTTRYKLFSNLAC